MVAKKYRCPYCTETHERQDLIVHIEENHEEMIPTGFTPTRIVFKVVNKKDHGVCVVCKKETAWCEESGKYERLCGNKKCREVLRKNALTNHIKVYNKPTLLDDDEHQTKMLANRKIAGTYKFEDGGEIGYVGTFEKKLLEFFDAMHIKSKDIMEPGPILEYDFHGKTKKWITDFLYIPYNLVIEVKDGGDNPNKRQMPEYRDKQLQKEKMITGLGTYNYLRLTNNNFSQLLGIFAEMKQQLIDDTIENKKAIIRINEETDLIDEEGLVRADFGVPEEKKFPLNSKQRVYIAVAYFNTVNPKYEKELAANIIKAMKKYKIKEVHPSPANRFSKYYTPVNEFLDMFSTKKIKWTKEDRKKAYDNAVSIMKSMSFKCPLMKKYSQIYGNDYIGDWLSGKDDHCTIYDIDEDKLPSIQKDEKKFNEIWKPLGSQVDTVVNELNKRMADKRVYAYAGSDNWICIYAVLFKSDLKQLKEARPNVMLQDSLFESVDIMNESFKNTLSKAFNPLHCMITRNDFDKATRIFRSKSSDLHKNPYYLKYEENSLNHKSICIINCGVNEYHKTESELNDIIKDINSKQDNFVFKYTMSKGSSNGYHPKWSYVVSFRKSGIVDESCGAVGGAMVGMEMNDQSVCSSNDNAYVINYGAKNTFSGDDDDEGTAVSNDIYSDKILIRRNGKTVKEDSSFLEGRDITIYQFNGSRDGFNKILESVDKVTDHDDLTYFYEILTGKPMLSKDQIEYDKDFNLYNINHIKLVTGSDLATMQEEFKMLMSENVFYFPAMSQRDLAIQESLSLQDPNLKLYEDINGYFVYNEATKLRTKSVNIDDITEAYR